ncbi:hypothetical protein M9458_043726, partial [Cirrhinus mrigala]
MDKLKKNIMGELTTLLNGVCLFASIGSTLAAQVTTITDMETSLADRSDRITHLEQEVSNLQSELTS